MPSLFPRFFLDGIVIENCSPWWFPFMGLTVWPFVLLRDSGFTQKGNPTQTLQHERIHLVQQAECGVLPFYALYFAELLIRSLIHGVQHAYENVSFEREAFRNEAKKTYLLHRRPFAFINYYINSRRLSYKETFEDSRTKLKDAHRRNMQNRKQKFEQLSPEEQVTARSERHRAEDAQALRMQRLVDSYSCTGLHPSVSVCIDLSFDATHSERERRSLCKQLCLSYNSVRTMPTDPLRLYVTGLRAGRGADAGDGLGLLEGSLAKQGVGQWALKVVPESAWEIPARCQDELLRAPGMPQTHESFPNMIRREQLLGNELLRDLSNFVMLSPDATDVILSFDSSKVGKFRVRVGVLF
jgi:hypothetical protein